MTQSFGNIWILVSKNLLLSRFCISHQLTFKKCDTSFLNKLHYIYCHCFFTHLVSEDIQSFSVSTNQTQSSNISNTSETAGWNGQTTTLESHEQTESHMHQSDNNETGFYSFFLYWFENSLPYIILIFILNLNSNYCK